MPRHSSAPLCGQRLDEREVFAADVEDADLAATRGDDLARAGREPRSALATTSAAHCRP